MSTPKSEIARTTRFGVTTHVFKAPITRFNNNCYTVTAEDKMRLIAKLREYVDYICEVRGITKDEEKPFYMSFLEPKAILEKSEIVRVRLSGDDKDKRFWFNLALDPKQMKFIFSCTGVKLRGGDLYREELFTMVYGDKPAPKCFIRDTETSKSKYRNSPLPF